MINATKNKCQNCETILKGQYCHNCGQNSDLKHRSIWTLLGEVIANVFQYDSRLWRTIPLLLFVPGKLNRDIIDGKHARYMKPFNIFVIATILMLFATEYRIDQAIHSKNFCCF